MVLFFAANLIWSDSICKMKRTRQEDPKSSTSNAVSSRPTYKEVTADEWFRDAASEDEFDVDSSDDVVDSGEEDEVIDSGEEEGDEEGEREGEAEEEEDENEDDEEDEDDESHDQLSAENIKKMQEWLNRYDPPSPEESEDENHNTVGKIPMQWYEEYPHIGYNREGTKIMKKERSKDQLDQFLDRTDDPNYW